MKFFEPVDKGLGLLTSYSNYDRLKTKLLYKGRYPEANNEIVLSYSYAKENNYEIGDIITIDNFQKLYGGSITKDMLIVGYTQSLNASRTVGGLVTDSFMLEMEEEFFKLNGMYEPTEKESYIYFKKGFHDLGTLNEWLKKGNARREEISKYLYPELSHIKVLLSYERCWDNIYSSVLSIAGPASEALLIVFIVIGILVISLLFAMILKIKIMKEGEDYAIQKALGYTSTDIMLSISVSLLLVSIVASLFGCVLGGLLTTPLLDVVGLMFGVGSMGFIVNWWYLVGIFAIVNVVVFLLSMLLSLRVRKISAIKLIRAN